MNARKVSIIVAAIIMVLVFQFSARTATADVLVQWPGDGQSISATGATGANQLLARLTVGPADVQIGGFGVYGQAQSEATLKWIIFDVTQQLTLPYVYLSDPVTVPANPGTPFSTYAQWYDSPAMDFTLEANHAYAMGIITNSYGTGGFQLGQNYYALGGNPTVSANGLTLPPGNYIVNSGVVGTSFTNTPTLFNVGVDTRFHTSLRVSSPVPEPASAILLAAAGLVGLLAMKLSTRRRRVQ